MGADETGSLLRGIGRPLALDLANIEDLGIGYGQDVSQASPVPGEAVRQNNTIMRLRTSGSQSDGGALTIQTKQANPRPGRYIWTDNLPTAPSLQWFGQDPIAPTGWASLFDTHDGTYTAVRRPHIAPHPSGQLVAVANTSSSGALGKVDVRTYDPATATWSAVTNLYTAALLGDGQWPCLAFNKHSGKMLCAHWVIDTAEQLAGIRVHEGTFDADAGTWSWETLSSQAVDQQIDTSGTVGAGADGYDLGRLRMAVSGTGQVVIIGALKDHNTSQSGVRFGNALVHYASADGGASFKQRFLDTFQADLAASALAMAIDHDLVVIDGIIHFVGVAVFSAGVDDSIVVIPMPNAFSPIQGRIEYVDPDDWTGLGSSGLVFDTTTSSVSPVGTHDLDRSAIWLDEDGLTLWAAVVCETGTYAGHMLTYMSPDRGQTWYATGDGDRLGTAPSHATTSDSNDTGQYHTHICAVSSYGRHVLLSQETDTNGNTTETISMIPLGGSTGVNLPARRGSPDGYSFQNWDATYFPIIDFSSVSSITPTTSGSNTTSVESDGVKVISTSGRKFWSDTITTTDEAGAVVLFEYTPEAGGTTSTNNRSLSIEVTDGSTTSYKVTLQMSATQFSIYDNVGLSTVATSSAKTSGTRTQVLVAVANGKVSCWERTADTSYKRLWTEVANGESITAETSSPASSSTIEWGHRVSSTVTTTWGALFHMENTEYTKGLAAGFSNPDGLFGRRFPGRGSTVLVDDGVRIGTLDGNPREGDQWIIQGDARFPLRNILHSISRTPRGVWRSQADGVTQVIPVKLNPYEAASPTRQGRMLSDLVYLQLRNINFHSFTVKYYDGTNWQTWATVDTRLAVDNTRLRNGFVHLDNTGTNSQPTKDHIHADEFAGCDAQWGSTLLRIVEHSEGVLDNAADHRLPIFEVLGDDGTAALSGLTFSIVPRDVLLVINTGGVAFRGVRIEIDAQSTYDGYYQMGMMELGSIYAFTDYAWGRTIETRPGTTVDDTADGKRLATDRAPAFNLIRFAWTFPMEQSDLHGSNPDPGFFQASDQGNNRPVGVPYDVANSLRYIVGRHGAGKPLLVLPALEKSTGAVSGTVTPATRNEEARLFVRKEDFYHVYVDSSVQVEVVQGNENQGRTPEGDPEGETVRLAQFVGREVV